MDYVNGKLNGTVRLNATAIGKVYLSDKTNPINMTYEQLAATWRRRGKRRNDTDTEQQ